MIDKLPRVRWQSLDITNANGQLAQRPRIGQPHAPDSHRAFGTLDGRFRNNADADVALDQSANGIEAAKLHAQTQRTPDAICLVRKETLDRAGAIQADHIVIEHLAKSDTRAIGQRMILRDHKHKAITAKWKRMKPAIVDGPGHNADVGMTFRHQADDLVT